MLKSYKTLMEAAQDEYIVNKSRFIGSAAPASTPEEALAFLAGVKERYRDANHHCYAYIIGQNAGIMRYSDDGEPGGTAGMPIMEVLKAKGLVDCAVVITRYFGGVLLGAGGLVRAYSHACAMAINAARVCEMHPTQRYMMEVPYPLWDKVRHTLKSLPGRLESTEFTAAVTFEMSVKTAESDTLLSELTRATDGRLEALLMSESFSPWAEAENESERGV